MERISRLASPKRIVPKFDGPKYGPLRSLHSSNQAQKPGTANRTTAAPGILRKVTIVDDKIQKPHSPDESAVPRPVDFVAPLVVEVLQQPKKLVISDLSLKLSCGDTPVVGKKIDKPTTKPKATCNMKRISSLSKPRVVHMAREKRNPFKVAKSATKPLSFRRVCHIERLAQIPKRNAQQTKLNKKKRAKLPESSAKIVK